MSDTKQRLLDGTLAVLREQGITAVSARSIAAAAGVNQALVFYHYGSIDDLLATACRQATQARLDTYAERFAAVTSLRELLQVGRDLHAVELREGNVSVLAQMLAAGQHGGKVAETTAAALQMWVDALDKVLERLLAGSPVAEIADVPGLARAVAAAFIGVELYEGVDPEGAERALASLDQLAVLVEVVDELGPLAQRALKSKIKRAGRS